MGAEIGATHDPAAAKARSLAYARNSDRLTVVRRAGLLDAGVQESLQRYAQLASELTGAPVALAAILDGEREYYSAAYGTDQTEAPLESSYSKYVADEGMQLAVSDTWADPRFAGVPSIAESPVRAYLGSPICAGGVRVGAFCLSDSEPRDWDDWTRRVLDELARAVSTEVEMRVLAAEQQAAAWTDPLTGLGNRRAMAQAIAQAVESGQTKYVGLLDLDGFKAYNDRFGYPAGDDLLTGLAHRLEQAVAEIGAAFRMGGDEFCVLVDSTDGLAAAQTSLIESGPAFCITSSLGWAEIPREAAHATTAIALADRRLHGEKRLRPGSVDDQLATALSVALFERDAEMAGHAEHVSTLASQVARRLGLNGEDVRQVTLAARLHDIGKIAIADSIINKTGPLDDEEWAHMKCHTLIGERIMAAAPDLAAAAPLVRSSHERWDGSGYPDGLEGERIPLGARIIFACDAYDAMRSTRPYRQPLTQRRAMEEMLRCAGSQFDPKVVEALIELTLPQAA
jgi:diguanylate cyclase (GGDEF)-like protein